MGHIKLYLKRVTARLEETNPSRVATFQKAAQEYVKKVIAKIDDYEFYTGAEVCFVHLSVVEELWDVR